MPKKNFDIMTRLDRDWEQGLNSPRYKVFYTGLHSPRPEDGILTLKQFKSATRQYKINSDGYLPTSLLQWLNFMGASLIDGRGKLL